MRDGLMKPPTQSATKPPEEPMEDEYVDSQEPDEELSGGEASPREQRLYDVMMEALTKMIHGKKSSKTVADQLKSGGTEMLDQTIAQMALTMFTAVERKIEQAGQELTDSVRLEVATDLLAELIELAVVLKLIPDEEQAVGQVMGGALDIMVSQYANQRRSEGKVDVAEAEASYNKLSGRAAKMFGADPMAAAVAGASGQMPPPGPAQGQGQGLMQPPGGM